MVRENSERIKAELAREEERFVKTLEKGEKILNDFIQKAKSGSGTLAGKEAFLLYDSFGFPVEMTVEISEEQGVKVDMDGKRVGARVKIWLKQVASKRESLCFEASLTAGFEVEMESQREQSKAAQEKVKLAVGNVLADVYQTIGKTDFLGYHSLQASCSVQAIVDSDGKLIQETTGESSRDTISLVFDRTVFYAEGGGQVRRLNCIARIDTKLYLIAKKFCLTTR